MISSLGRIKCTPVFRRLQGATGTTQCHGDLAPWPWGYGRRLDGCGATTADEATLCSSAAMRLSLSQLGLLGPLKGPHFRILRRPSIYKSNRTLVPIYMYPKFSGAIQNFSGAIQSSCHPAAHVPSRKCRSPVGGASCQTKRKSVEPISDPLP